MSAASTAVHELFRTPVWVVDLEPQLHRPLNQAIARHLDGITGPRQARYPGQTWQTHQELHAVEVFQPLVQAIRQAVRGALSFLDVEYEDFSITGCWANINPPGAKHSSHTHPNNYLSGVYYVQTEKGADAIVFTDPRPQASVVLPKVKKFNMFNGNLVTLDAKPGRLVLFPAWLVHGVPMNRSKRERISVAFNIMFTGYGDRMTKPLWQQTAATEP